MDTKVIEPKQGSDSTAVLLPQQQQQQPQMKDAFPSFFR